MQQGRDRHRALAQLGRSPPPHPSAQCNGTRTCQRNEAFFCVCLSRSASKFRNRIPVWGVTSMQLCCPCLQQRIAPSQRIGHLEQMQIFYCGNYSPSNKIISCMLLHASTYKWKHVGMQELVKVESYINKGQQRTVTYKSP